MRAGGDGMTMEQDEYREGEDVSDRVHLARNPGMVVSVRVDGAEARRLRRYARETERTVSEVARLAIRSFLDAEARSQSLGTFLSDIRTDEFFTYGQPASAKTFGETLGTYEVDTDEG